MKFNNHIPVKYLAIVGIMLFAAGMSMGYWIRQFDDLEIYPAPDEQYLPNKPTTQRDSDNDSMLCTQVITRARNTTTGSVVSFPTPCDVPAGWTIVQ
jgi:hypothetical protein